MFSEKTTPSRKLQLKGFKEKMLTMDSLLLRICAAYSLGVLQIFVRLLSFVIARVAKEFDTSVSTPPAARYQTFKFGGTIVDLHQVVRCEAFSKDISLRK